MPLVCLIFIARQQNVYLCYRAVTTCILVTIDDIKVDDAMQSATNSAQWVL